MAGVLFCLEHFVVHADRHGAVLGLILLALEALLGAAIYLSALAVLAPHVSRELIGVLRARARSGLARTHRGSTASS